MVEVALSGPRAQCAPCRYNLPALDSSQNEEHARNLPQVPTLQNTPIISQTRGKFIQNRLYFDLWYKCNERRGEEK